MKNKNIITYIIICLIIIAGLAVWEAKGFKSELQYAPRKQIQLKNETGVNISEVKNIASEVLGKTEFYVQPVEKFGSVVSIVAREITEEQKNQIVTKFNEKHKTKLKNEDIKIVSIPFTRIKDIIKPFLVPGAVTLILVSIYFAIKYKKLGWKSVLVKTILIPAVAETLIYSLMAIARIPIGRLGVALGVGIYGAIIIALTMKFENTQKEYIEKTENNNQ